MSDYCDNRPTEDGFLYAVPDPTGYLNHYGTPRHSGRYPWGSGKNPYQRSGDFLSAMEKMLKNGSSEKALADELGMTTTEFRTSMRVARHERDAEQIKQIMYYRDQGLGPTEIGRKMNMLESTVRSKIKNCDNVKQDAVRDLAKRIQAEVEKKGVVDIGKYTELQLGVSAERLKEAVFILEAENGYFEGGVGVKRAEAYKGRGNQTNTKILAKTEDLITAATKDNGLIKPLVSYDPDKDPMNDGHMRPNKVEYPASITKDRVAIRYGDAGGEDKDGVIEIRRGVKDLDLGESHYAQVRIMVDDSHYLKGMAIYSDSIPDGKDIVFNTNKKTGTPFESVLKAKKSDPDNPFGATVTVDGQSTYIGDDGNPHLSAINKLKWEGKWDTDQSKNLSSQFLSKQPIKLIKNQLNLTIADKEAQFEELKNLTNPAVKEKMLMDFAESCDMAAVHLKAAGLPRQRTQVLLPVPTLKENEIYAPNFQNGEKVALVRYPHAGPFEIPILTVNNKNAEGKAFIGPHARDAIGINHATAEKLSGADFDGDTAVVLPLKGADIMSKPVLEDLKGFDPKKLYSTNYAGKKWVSAKDPKTGKVKRDEQGNVVKEEVDVYTDDYGNEVKILKDGARHKGKEMGIVSNLITDMYLAGAPDDKLARAVKHSMVVIDAPKHKLDYKRSERENRIDELKAEFQPKRDENGNIIPGESGGASTLISKHKTPTKVPERMGGPRVDGETGKVTYGTTGRKYKDPKTGEWVPAMDESPLLLETEDLRTLSSGTPQENAYAEYGNYMKDLANRARLVAKHTPNIEYQPSARKKYAKEVEELESALKIAKLNKPRERQAQAIANSIIKLKLEANDEMTKEEETKMRSQAIIEARYRAGASGRKTRINISDKQWEAIQAGALRHTQVREILDNSDQDRFKELALPKQENTLSDVQINRIKAMESSGYTNEEIAQRLGISTSTVIRHLS